MSGYLDGKVEVLYDLGSVCTTEPIEAFLPYIVRLHDELGLREFHSLSELKNTVDIYRQGGMTYEDVRDEVQRETGEILTNASVDKTEQYVNEILGVEEPSTNLVERMRRSFRKWMFDLPEREPLVNPEVRTGFQLLESAGSGILGITDEPSFIAEPVAHHLLGMENPHIAAVDYAYNDKRRYTGDRHAIEDKGEIAENYLQYRRPALSLGFIDSPADQSMGEVLDIVYVVDPDKPVEDEMERWAEKQESAELVDNPVAAFHRIYQDIVENVEAPRTTSTGEARKAVI